MKTVRCSLAELPQLIAQDMQRIDGRVKVIGLAGAAIDGAHVVAANAPVAFADLRESVHADLTESMAGHARVVVDAPHAAPVETGSRPHTPPLEPLIKWVKLRGMQGIDKRGGIRGASRRAWGSTTAKHAHRVATQIAATERDGTVDVDAPEAIARAIQMAIRKHGTKPTWFVKNSLKKIRDALDKRMRNAVKG